MSWQIAIDEPKSFELLQPASLEEALDWAARYGDDAALLAGGCDLLDKLKTQWATPRYVINLKAIPSLREVTASEASLQLGALATLGSLERDARLRQLVPALGKAAAGVATPQIRNQGTVGGNLLQDSRCSYYRGPWHCYRAGGIVCDAVRGINSEHAIFGGDRCYTVTPSDLAPVMVALDATATINSARRAYQSSFADLFLSPKVDIRRMHRLAQDEILTAIAVPLRARQRSTFIKYAMRNAWDFALASIAVAFIEEGATARNVRIVLGAVAPTPWRSRAAEAVIEGKQLSDTLIEEAARLAVAEAEPLTHNEYKIGLVKKLLRAAFTELSK